MKKHAILGSAVVAAACSVMGSDFDKAVFVGKLNPPQKIRLREEVRLQQGRAELIVVVPGRMCESPQKTGIIDVAVEVPRVPAVNRAVDLEHLKWSYAKGSCNGYGYEPDGIPFAVNLPDGGERVVVTAAIRGDTGGDIRLWFIYGGRVPGARIFQ